jgi:hypothetical protein
MAQNIFKKRVNISEVILLDGYNGDGLPDVLCQRAVLCRLLSSLTPR